METEVLAVAKKQCRPAVLIRTTTCHPTQTGEQVPVDQLAVLIIHLVPNLVLRTEVDGEVAVHEGFMEVDLVLGFVRLGAQRGERGGNAFGGQGLVLVVVLGGGSGSGEQVAL